MCALGKLATQKTADTATTYIADKIVWFLNYAAIHSSANIRYHASGMVLHMDSNVSCLSVSNTRSSVGSQFFLSDASTDPMKPLDKTMKPNKLLHAISSILCHIRDSGAEAVYKGLFSTDKI